MAATAKKPSAMPGRRAHGVGRAQDAVDDERLAADLGGDPAGLHRDHRRHAGHRRRAQEPHRARDPVAPPPRPAEPQREQHQRRADARPSCCRRGARRSPAGAGRAARSAGRSPRRWGRGSPAATAPRGSPAPTAAGRSRKMPPSESGTPRPVSKSPSIAASLTGWFSATVAAIQSPTSELDRRRDRREGQRDQQAEAVVAVAAAAQHPHGVHRGDQVAGHHVGGDQHVHELRPGGRAEHRPRPGRRPPRARSPSGSRWGCSSRRSRRSRRTRPRRRTR